MKEITGDIFNVPDADCICVTTNGILRKDGRLVMGAGIALEFAKRFPYLPADFGSFVKQYGNRPCYMDGPNHRGFMSFPTKNHWRDKSDLQLIQNSAKEAVQIADRFGLKKIILTRPGCGLGGLSWATVKAVIAPILDDRFHVITPK